jgi:hypothetical protein
MNKSLRAGLSAPRWVGGLPRARLSVASLTLALACGLSHAADLPPGMAAGNIFVDALQHGEASAPIPTVGRMGEAVHMLQKQARDPGPVYMRAKRVARFVDQSRCGRVTFMVEQPSSHKAWGNLGGALNLCEDGQPPLRVCKDRPLVLVPHTAHCADGSAPMDTAEVADAIRVSLTAGFITPKEASERWKREHPAASEGASGGAKP